MRIIVTTRPVDGYQIRYLQNEGERKWTKLDFQGYPVKGNKWTLEEITKHVDECGWTWEVE